MTSIHCAIDPTLEGLIFAAFPRESVIRTLPAECDIREFARAENPSFFVFDRDHLGPATLTECRAIRTDPVLNAVPIMLIFGARATPEEIVAYTRLPLLDFVVKPVSGHDFRIRVQLLSKSARAREVAEDDEKREYARSPIRTRVIISSQSADSRRREEAAGVVTDISSSGVKIMCNYTYHTGDVVSIRILGRDEKPLLVGAAEIIRADMIGSSFEYGLRFVDVNGYDGDG